MRKDVKEIRNLLLGKAVVDEEGRMVTPAAGTFRVPNGIVDGAGAVRFLGISGKTQCYETDLSEEEIMARAREFMRNTGRGVYLRYHPDAAACLIRYVITRPALLVFRWIEGQGVLTAWTGRGFMSWTSRLRAIRAFERTMGDVIRYSTVPPPEEEPEEKKRRRKRKKAAPEEDRTPLTSQDGDAENEYGAEYGEGFGEEYADENTDDYVGDYDGDYADDYDGDYVENNGEGYADEYGAENGKGYNEEYDPEYDERYSGEYDRKTDEEDRRE